MALTLIKSKICNACGAEVRPNTLFCYSCGSGIADIEKKEDVLEAKEPVQDAVVEKEKVIAEKTIEPIETGKQNIPEEVKLESAAALRRKSKSFQNKKVEVVWQEHENAPNGWFISVTIILTIIAAVVLFLAVRLK